MQIHQENIQKSYLPKDIQRLLKNNEITTSIYNDRWTTPLTLQKKKSLYKKYHHQYHKQLLQFKKDRSEKLYKKINFRRVHTEQSDLPQSIPKYELTSANRALNYQKLYNNQIISLHANFSILKINKKSKQQLNCKRSIELFLPEVNKNISIKAPQLLKKDARNSLSNPNIAKRQSLLSFFHPLPTPRAAPFKKKTFSIFSKQFSRLPSLSQKQNLPSNSLIGRASIQTQNLQTLQYQKRQLLLKNVQKGDINPW